MIKKEYESAFLMDLIFGPTSEFYKKNLEAGLINSTFGSETIDGEGFFVNIIEGESKDPVKLRELINEEIKRVKREGISREDFNDMKKSRYASAIRAFANVESCASLMLDSYINSAQPFDAIETSSLSIVEPAQQ